jgi:hypothetical protein
LFTIKFTPKNKEQYDRLRSDSSQGARYKAVKKAIEYLAQNPHHRSLETHEFKGMQGRDGQKVFEAYSQNETPAAWGVFWYYGPDKTDITIAFITRHP